MTPNDVILRVVQAVEVIISRFVWAQVREISSSLIFDPLMARQTGCAKIQSTRAVQLVWIASLVTEQRE